MTLICFTCMVRERSAVRQNLLRVTGRSGWANLRLAYRLFLNFSRILVSYTKMRDTTWKELEDNVTHTELTDSVTRELLGQGRGIIIVTMHLGHWDLGVRLLSRYGVPVHLVMLRENEEELNQYADRARWIPGLKIHQTGESPLLAVELMLALHRGEIVAVQLDRAVGQSVLPMTLFGAPALLPTGPIRLALATKAPLLPVFVILDGKDRYRLISLPPVRVQATSSGDEDRVIRETLRRLAKMMESVVSQYPDQWFNFYDIWSSEERPGPKITSPRLVGAGKSEASS